MVTIHIDEKMLDELNSRRDWSDYGAVISYEDLAHVLGIEYDGVKLLHFSKIQTEEASVNRAFYEKYSDQFELAGCSYYEEVAANVFFYHNPLNDWNVSVYLKNGRLETYNPLDIDMNASQARAISNREPHKTFADMFMDLIYDRILQEARKGEDSAIISIYDLSPETLNEIEIRLLAGGYQVAIPNNMYIKW